MLALRSGVGRPARARALAGLDARGVSSHPRSHGTVASLQGTHKLRAPARRGLSSAAPQSAPKSVTSPTALRRTEFKLQTGAAWANVDGERIDDGRYAAFEKEMAAIVGPGRVITDKGRIQGGYCCIPVGGGGD